MTMLPPLPDSLIVDRKAELRATYDGSLAWVVTVFDGRIATEDGRVRLTPPGSAPNAALEVYLGQHEGRDLVAVVPHPGAEPDGMVGLRELLSGVPALDRELASTAVAITTWHANHPHCAFCGARTVPVPGGWVRKCPEDGRDHYPRTDPAVIMAITDDDDRLLISHAAYWSPKRYSHLAGYVEPGESFEQAVHRECMEEAQLTVRELVYVGSQPWPFPASVMVGYRARANGTEITVDGEEITDARFVTRDEVKADVTEGRLVLPTVGSIANAMFEDWYGGPAPQPVTDGSVPVDNAPFVMDA